MGYPSRKYYEKCVDCGITGKSLSNKGLCRECSWERMKKAAAEMRDKNGDAYIAWKKAMALFLVRELQD